MKRFPFPIAQGQSSLPALCQTLFQVSLATLLWVLPLKSADASCLGGCTQNGLTFSEASSDFEITGISGSGLLRDPFTIEQNVYGLDITLAIQGLTLGRNIGIRPGFVLRIGALNLTNTPWRFYDHELQEVKGIASGENDGLSFAQGLVQYRPFIASDYRFVDEVTDVRDFLNFSYGVVNPGARTWFTYVITDTIPNSLFFLRQRPEYQPGQAAILPVPTPIPPAPIEPTPISTTPVEPTPIPLSSPPPTPIEPTPISPTPVEPPISDPNVPLPIAASVPEPAVVKALWVLGLATMWRWRQSL